MPHKARSPSRMCDMHATYFSSRDRVIADGVDVHRTHKRQQCTTQCCDLLSPQVNFSAQRPHDHFKSTVADVDSAFGLLNIK